MSDALDDLFEQAEEAKDQEQWDFEENPEIRGILVGVGVAPGREHGPYHVLRIKEQTTGQTFGIPVWGIVLIGQAASVAPKVGAPIGIRFNGSKPNKDGSRSYKDWTLVSTQSDYEAWQRFHAELQAMRGPARNTTVVVQGGDDSFF